MSACSKRGVARLASSIARSMAMCAVCSGCFFGVRSSDNAPGSVDLDAKPFRAPKPYPGNGSRPPPPDPTEAPVSLDTGKDPGTRGWLFRGSVFAGGGVQGSAPAYTLFGGELGVSRFESSGGSNDWFDAVVGTHLHPTVGWVAFRSREQERLSHGRLYGELQLPMSRQRGFGSLRPGVGASGDLERGGFGPTASLCGSLALFLPEVCARGTIHFPYSPELFVTVSVSTLVAWGWSR